MPNSRRAFFKTGAVAIAGGAAVSAAPVAKAGPLQVTPACAGHETPPALDGPLFKPSSPERTNLITPSAKGVRLDLRGVAYSPQCAPIQGALVDFWQCDQNGDYDTLGFGLRGHQFTNRKGEYHLNTIIPRDYFGQWGWRAPHIHVQIQAPDGPPLVTQLYFPDDTQAYGRDFAALNAGDEFINRVCTIQLARSGSGYRGTFDFVIKTTVGAP
ncbi:dioxygenase [Lentzea sp. NPDC051213]|uniref:dioxygenase family protein n=1 Tax=Lentzea sp. NPDC051213 TaxID=3364126 RepID=UPI00378E0F00